MQVQRPEPPRRRDIAFAVFTGVLIAGAAFQSFVSHSGWVVTPLLVVAIVTGSVAAAILACVTGIPQAMGRKGAAFWEGGAITRIVIVWSFYACASIVVVMALFLLFGTRPSS